MINVNSKKFIGILLLIVVVLLVLVIVLTVVARPTKYSLVVLRSGEIFIGQLKHFPSLRIVDPWVPQTAADNQSINLVPWKNTFWGPEDVIYLRKDSIMYTTPIAASSQVFKIVGTPSVNLPVVPQMPAPSQGGAVQQPSQQQQSPSR